jgi:hypothetical protein
MSNGALLRFDTDGAFTVVGTEFHPLVRDIEFGADGALYLSEDVGQILRIAANCAPADIDESGIVDVSDFLLLLGQWGDCPPLCIADIDGDGTVGVLDFLLLLKHWGPCL